MSNMISKLRQYFFLNLLLRFGIFGFFVAVIWAAQFIYYNSISNTWMFQQEQLTKVMSYFIDSEIAYYNLFAKTSYDKTFYTTETSENKQIKDLFNSKESISHLLLNLPYSEKRQVLFQELDSWMNEIKMLIELEKTLGYKDWGLEGKWREQIHVIEKVLENSKDIRATQMKLKYGQLRREEKDFLLRNESEYIEKLKAQIMDLKTYFPDFQVQLLNNYLTYFLKYADLLTKKYESQKLIMKKESLIKQYLNDLYFEETNRTIQSKNSLKLQLLLSFIFLSILFLVILWHISKSVSRPLTDLRDIVVEIGKGKLDQYPKVTRKDEIGFLQREIGTMLHELRKMEIQSKLATVGALSSNIAHDLKNPLGSLQLITHKMKKDLVSQPISVEKLMSSLNRQEGTIQRMNDIIMGILLLAKQNLSGNDHKEHIPVLRLFKQVQLLIDFRLHKDGIELSWPDIDPQITVVSHPTQLTQVLINLLTNSCDAIAEHPIRWIKLNAIADGNVTRISVEDSGNGVPESVKEKLFVESFTTKPSDKGTGLGLPLCKKLIEANDGKIWLDKAENTRFVIQLPRS